MNFLSPRPLYVIDLYTFGKLSHYWTSNSRPENLGGAVRFLCAETGARMYVPGDVRVMCIPALFHGSHSRAGYSDRPEFPRYAPHAPDPDRCTGRTSLMLTKAIVAHREGKRVFVVALDQSELRDMIDLLHKFGFKPPASRFMLCTIDRLDPTYGLRGPDAVVFLDHAVEHVAKSIPNPQLAMLRYMGLIAT